MGAMDIFWLPACSAAATAASITSTAGALHIQPYAVTIATRSAARLEAGRTLHVQVHVLPGGAHGSCLTKLCHWQYLGHGKAYPLRLLHRYMF